MELVCASSTSIMKLCAFPSGAGSGSGASVAPTKYSSSSSGPVPMILYSWKPSPGSKDPRALGETEAMVSLDGNTILSSHSFQDSPGSITFVHFLKLVPHEENNIATPYTQKKKQNGSEKKKNGKETNGKSEAEQNASKPPQIEAHCFPLLSLNQSQNQTVSLQAIPNTKKFIHVTSNGVVSICDYENGFEELRKEFLPVEKTINEESTKKGSKKNGKSKKEAEEEEKKKEEGEKKPETAVIRAQSGQLEQFQLGQNVRSVRLNPYEPTLMSIVGEQGVLLNVWNVEEKKQIWKGRNVKADMLKMAVPVWDLSSDWSGPHTLITSTAHSHVRVYDVREKRQPILSISVADELANTMGPTKFQQITKQDVAFSLRVAASNPHNPSLVAVGSNLGDVFILNIDRPTKQGHIVSRQKGVQGAVRSMAFHPSKTNALLVSGLDRFLRSWDVSKSKSLGTLYTKLRQNHLCFTNVLAPILKAKKKTLKEEKEATELNLDSDDDSGALSDLDSDDISMEDDVWGEIPVVHEKNGKKKKHSEEDDDEEEIKPQKSNKKRNRSDSSLSLKASPSSKKSKTK